MSPRELSAIFNVCNELDFSQTLKFAAVHQENVRHKVEDLLLFFM